MGIEGRAVPRRGFLLASGVSPGEQRPALAVIVRTLGRPAVAEALDSLARQTCRDFEAVIVDMSGGALDGPLAAVAPRLPAVKHLAVGKRLNRPAALNAGIAATDAAAIGVLDDDNLYGPEHVGTLVRGLKESAADLVYTPVRRQTLTPDGVLIGEEIMSAPFSRSRLMFGNFIYATSTAYSREIWRRVGCYDTRFPVYEDWEFLIRVAHAGRIAAIGGGDAISRNFTGDRAAPAHNAEAGNCARSMAGVFWTHRRHYTDAFFAGHADLVAGHPHVPRRGYQRSTAGSLAAWWWRNVLVSGPVNAR